MGVGAIEPFSIRGSEKTESAGEEEGVDDGVDILAVCEAWIEWIWAWDE